MSSTSTHDVQSELRDLWRTRPVRTPDESKIAGVCGGVARRYGVDPVLIRIAFVIAALWGGAGIFLYALAWLFLRSAGDEVSPGEALLGRGRASGSKGTALVLVVVVFLSAPTLGGSGATFFVGAGVLMTAAMLAGWYGLHRRTPTPPAGWAEVSARPQQRETAGDAEPGSGPHAPYGPPAPPRWDPLGAAPFAWDLPEPGTEPAPGPRQDRPRSRLTKVTLGLALIAVAVSVGLATLGSIAWLDATTIAAIALAVVAGGLLIGAITRRGHGLLVVAGPLAGFVLLSSLVDPYLPEGGWENAGELQIAITDPADLSEPVRHEIGGVTVDLRGLELDRDRSYSISNNVGEVRVLLPEDLNVDATCRNDVGRVDCPAGTDTPEPSGPVLTLDVHNRVGTVEVSR
ncbi:MAG TPA: PspC domain-containing protein [Candidatus Dietzia intestinipullorum]|nr:PspC domain-containing protein [Candidatus Dietzia intestinipullorum]